MNKQNRILLVANNKKAYHDYTIEKKYESGIVLLGWEVKSLRGKGASIKEARVIIKNFEAWLLNASITPLSNVPSYLNPDQRRTRKLLLKYSELKHIYGYIKQRGYTVVPLQLYWKDNLLKLEIALAKGKKLYDKRMVQKDRDWLLDKQRMLKRQ